jgi:hypothetical protein
MCLFAGGIHFSEQGFSIVQAQTNSALLVVSVIVVLLLGTFDFSINLMNPDGQRLISLYQHDVLRLSHGISVVLVIRTRVVNSHQYGIADAPRHSLYQLLALSRRLALSHIQP